VINVRVIRPEDMRYPTVGDWIIEADGSLAVYVADMGNADYNFLVGLHETVEAYLCLRSGISEETVTKWDIEHLDLDEPGADCNSPYFVEHVAAEEIEKQVAAQLGVDWKAFGEAIDEQAKKTAG
jgi:hypothetical protein